MFNRMLILCSVVGVLLFLASSTDGDVADFGGGHIHENNHHTLSHQSHRFIDVNNGTDEQILYLNETAALKSHEIITDILADTGGHPASIVSSIITECLLQMSFSCAQKKFLLFLYQLEGVENIELIGKSVSVVRTGEVYSYLVNDSGFKDRLNNIKDQEGVLGILVEESVGRYLDNHVIRVNLPAWIRAEVEGYSEATNALDFGLGNIPADEGRGKKIRGHHGGHGGGHGGGHHGGGKKGDKGGKKMLMAMKKMMSLMMMGKFAMMLPMMLGSAKLIAAKGMMVGMTSLLMSIIVKVMGFMGSGKKAGGGGKIKVGGGPYPPSGVPAGGGGCGGCGSVGNTYGHPSGGGCGVSGCGGGSVTMLSNSYGAPFKGGESEFSGGISDNYGARGGGGGSSDSYGAPLDSGVVTSNMYGAPNWSKRSSSANHHEGSLHLHNNTEEQ